MILFLIIFFFCRSYIYKYSSIRIIYGEGKSIAVICMNNMQLCFFFFWLCQGNKFVLIRRIRAVFLTFFGHRYYIFGLGTALVGIEVVALFARACVEMAFVLPWPTLFAMLVGMEPLPGLARIIVPDCSVMRLDPMVLPWVKTPELISWLMFTYWFWPSDIIVSLGDISCMVSKDITILVLCNTG